MHLKKILTISFFALVLSFATNATPALAETYTSSSASIDKAQWTKVLQQAQERIKYLQKTGSNRVATTTQKVYPTYGDDAKKVETKTYPTYGDDAKKVDYYKGYPADAAAILKKVQERIEWIKSQKPGSSGTFTLPPNTEGKPEHSDPIPKPVDLKPKHSDPLPPYIGTSTPKHSDPLPPYIPGTGGPAAKNLLFDARSKESTQAFFDSIRLRIEKLKAEANN